MTLTGSFKSRHHNNDFEYSKTHEWKSEHYRCGLLSLATQVSFLIGIVDKVREPAECTKNLRAVHTSEALFMYSIVVPVVSRTVVSIVVKSNKLMISTYDTRQQQQISSTNEVFGTSDRTPCTQYKILQQGKLVSWWSRK